MNRLPSIRRWGVAALTGVTLFGGLSIVGAGAAGAATPTVTAGITAGSVATTISGNQAAGTENAARLTLTVNGAIAVGDQITLTLGCPTTGTASFALAIPTVTPSGTAVFHANAPTTNTSGCSTETLVATTGDTATTSTIALAGIQIATTGVSSQALSITGTYATIGLAATTFTVPTIASVAYYAVTSNTPAVTLPVTGTSSLSQITITQPTNLVPADRLSGALPGTSATVTGTTTSAVTGAFTGTLANQVLNKGDVAGNTVTLTVGTGTVTSLTSSGVPTGMTLTPATVPSVGTPLATGATDIMTLTGTPTAAGTYPIVLTASNGTASSTTTYNLVVAPAVITLTLPATDTWGGSPTLSAVGAAGSVAIASAHVLDLTVTNQPAPGFSGTWTISGATDVTSSGAVGTHTAAVTYTNAAGTAGTVMSSSTVGTVLGGVTTIYGADGTADGTVAAEFENAYPASAGNASSGNRNVVLATDIPRTNGSDALAASYLEGTLGTGLLITTPTTLGADAKQAMQIEGVTTVYVVGGPLAITPAVIAQIKATPAYNPGGLTQTGSNINVVGPIYGADGTAAGTAAAIATYFGTAYGSATFPSAYSNTGIGSYNTTTGLGTTTAPTGVVPTAIVVASSDWQDALSVAPEAFAMRFPIILNGPSTDTTLSATASATLTSLGVKQVIIVGGQLALQNSVETQIAAVNGGISVLRIAGIDNTDTAAQIANFAWGTSGVSGLGWTAASGHDSVIVSHGDYWTDALGAAALGGGANQGTFGFEPILLAQSPLVVGQYTTAELAKVPTGVVNLTVLGGPLAMPSSTVQTLLAGL